MRSPVAFARILGVAASLDAIDRGGDLRIEAGRLRVPVVMFGIDLPTPTLPSPVAIGFGIMWLLGGVMLLVGRQRIGAAAVLASSSLALTIDQQLYSNHTVLIACLCILLLLSDTASTLAFTVRAQISTVYVFAALSKLRSPWWSGDILRESADGPLGLVVARDLPDASLTALAIWVIAFELTLAVIIWKGDSAALIAAAGFHLGVIAVIGNQIGLWAFAAAMLSHFALPSSASTRSEMSIPPSPTPAR